ncbi:MAG: Ppx/GppA phosphatase family protein [Actinomycetota bacterium]|nr:Ppx/GppA phosphatase family protein [Actinomycetota bacterium]
MPDSLDSFAKLNPISAASHGGVTVAALDMGSNSFHLVVARGFGSSHFDVLLKEKVMMRLGDEVAATKRLSTASGERILEVVGTMAALARGVGATEMVALATAAFRDARNAGEIVDAIEEIHGIKVSVISGRREAELIWGAVSRAVDFGGHFALSADLGGGSMEVCVGNQENLLDAESHPIGVGRLKTGFPSLKDPSGLDLKALRAFLGSELNERLKRLCHEFSPQIMVLSSGSFLNIARMAMIRAEGSAWWDASLNQVSIPLDTLASVTADLQRLDSRARAKLPGIDEKRLDLLPAAAAVLDLLIGQVQPSQVLASEWALREGIILRELAQRSPVEFSGDERSVKEASIIGLASRYGWNEGHARQVSSLALSVFDQTRPLHRMGAADREMLYLASLVHDIGEYISVEGHDRHGAYLLENSRLPGFDPEERNQLVSIVRYHRRGTPKGEYAPYAALSKEGAAKATKLAAILRLADALDRSHTRLVDSIEVRIQRTQVLIFVDAHDNVELEEYGLRRKRQLFEEVFGRSVHLIQDGHELSRPS